MNGCLYRQSCHFSHGSTIVSAQASASRSTIDNLEQTRGPFRFWTPTEPGGRDERVEVFDRRTGRRYRLVVEPRPPWLMRPRYLAFIVLVLAFAGVL